MIKPYKGLIRNITTVSSAHNHLHIVGFSSYGEVRLMMTSAVVNIDFHMSGGYIEIETLNSRYGIAGDDYDSLETVIRESAFNDLAINYIED